MVVPQLSGCLFPHVSPARAQAGRPVFAPTGAFLTWYPGLSTLRAGWVQSENMLRVQGTFYIRRRSRQARRWLCFDKIQMCPCLQQKLLFSGNVNWLTAEATVARVSCHNARTRRSSCKHLFESKAEQNQTQMHTSLCFLDDGRRPQAPRL